MKKFIIFFCLVIILFIQNTRLYSQEESGGFYFLKSTDNDKQSIMYLHIIGNEVYGSYHIPNTSFDFYGNIKNGNIEANLYEQFSSNAGGNINAKFDDNKITLKGKYNSDKISLYSPNISLNTIPILSYYSSINKALGIELEFKYIAASDEKLRENQKTINEAINFYSSIHSYRYINEYEATINRYVEQVDYLDNKIMCISYYGTYIFDRHLSGEYWEEHSVGYKVYYKNTLKEVEVSDFIVNSTAFIRAFNEKANEFNRNANDELTYFPPIESLYDLNYIIFTFTSNRKLIFLVNNESYVFSQIEFTFDELKPFIKDGSPLEYLFY